MYMHLLCMYMYVHVYVCNSEAYLSSCTGDYVLHVVKEGHDVVR